MLVEDLGKRVLRGRKEAATVAFGCALVGTIIPFVGWIATVIMALVTLRKGPLDGFFVLCWTALPLIAFAFLGHPIIFIYGVLCGSLLTWALAAMLRKTHSWPWVLQAGTLLGLIVVVMIHGIMPNVGQLWYNLLFKYYSSAEQALALQVTATDLKEVIHLIAKIATGMQAVALLFSAFFNLLLARWWQAMLFNPGGLSKELYHVRLSFTSVAVLVAIGVASFMSIATALDLLPLIFGLFFAVGLSLIHFMAKKTKVSVALLLLFYGALIFLFPYMGTMVVALAVVDTFVDFRGRINRQMA